MIQPLELRRQDEAIPGFLGFSSARQYAEIEAARPSILSPPEARAFAEAGSPERRSSYLLGRHAAKQALGALLHESAWTRIQVDWGVFGQPIVRCAGESPPEISIAHASTAAVAVACAAGHPIGVDLETVTPPRETIAADACLAEERALLGKLGATAPGSLMIWTAKESLTKALRCGLMTPFAVLAVESLEAQASGAWVALFRNFPQYQAVVWPLPSHYLAIALPRRTTIGFRPAADLVRPLSLPAAGAAVDPDTGTEVRPGGR